MKHKIAPAVRYSHLQIVEPLTENKYEGLALGIGRCGGRGIFTVKPFAGGQLVLVFGGEKLREAELLHEDHSIQVGVDLFLGPSGELDDLVNHSCSPNCGLILVDGELQLIAIRDIAAGEELSFDYSTSVGVGDAWAMECRCGSTECRGRIASFVELSEEVQRKYVKLGVVPFFAFK